MSDSTPEPRPNTPEPTGPENHVTETTSVMVTPPAKSESLRFDSSSSDSEQITDSRASASESSSESILKVRFYSSSSESHHCFLSSDSLLKVRFDSRASSTKSGPWLIPLLGIRSSESGHWFHCSGKDQIRSVRIRARVRVPSLSARASASLRTEKDSGQLLSFVARPGRAGRPSFVSDLMIDEYEL